MLIGWISPFSRIPLADTWESASPEIMRCAGAVSFRLLPLHTRIASPRLGGTHDKSKTSEASLYLIHGCAPEEFVMEDTSIFEVHRLSKLRDMQPVPDLQTCVKLSIGLGGLGLDGIYLVRNGHVVPGT